MSLNSTDRLLDEIFDVYSEDNVKKEKMVLELLEDVKEYILICPEQFSKYYEDYDLYYSRIQDYQQMIRKLKNIQVIEYMDMSKQLGLTVEEMEYVIKNTKKNDGESFISNERLVKEIAWSIVKTVEIYPINEIFVLSVMSFETGYFSSKYVVKYNNFGGMKLNGEPIKFETVQDGLEASVKCLNSNLKGNNTVYKINETYCEPMGENGEDVYGWSRNVLSIMKTYASAIE